MARDGFSERLAYVRWLGNAGALVPESDKALAARAQVGYEWLKKWMKRGDAPDDRVRTKKLVAALATDGEWLLDGEGSPPNEELWRFWTMALLARAGVHPIDPALFKPVARPASAKKRSSK